MSRRCPQTTVSGIRCRLEHVHAGPCEPNVRDYLLQGEKPLGAWGA